MRILGLLLLLAMGLAACRDKGPKTEVVYATDPNVMKVGSKDSAAVKTLVTMFMDRMKSGHPDSALMLLRTAKKRMTATMAITIRLVTEIERGMMISSPFCAAGECAGSVCSRGRSRKAREFAHANYSMP